MQFGVGMGGLTVWGAAAPRGGAGNCRKRWCPFVATHLAQPDLLVQHLVADPPGSIRVVQVASAGFAPDTHAVEDVLDEQEHLPVCLEEGVVDRLGHQVCIHILVPPASPTVRPVSSPNWLATANSKPLCS
eukprot:8558834-Alexandrium_andersonii.AAC.1